ncbi:MAG TPA: IS1 family transposase [Acidobacteriaceae bacterium]|jgi:IS1 family transposase|nr:IS1 family transposase [Acidobacteriaceae bacterium]
MNTLSQSERIQIVAALVEGNSLRSVSRMTGIARNTITKLLVDLGQACMEYHDEKVRNVKVKRLQCDEIWAYVGAKARNVSAAKKEIGWGDVWTWVGLDADTKLVVSYLVGGRGAGWARDFMMDCAARIAGTPQITTDAHKPYLKAVEEAFGGDADYAMLHKIFGAPTSEEQRRYSPAACIGCDMKTISGIPNPKHVSTSYVERQNLTMRMSMRRFTRLTNGFSKKLENHAYAVGLHFMYCNFVRIHQTLRVTPAMEAGLSNHAWEMSELVGLLSN